VDLTVPSVESASHRHKKEALEKGFGLVLAAIIVVQPEGAPSITMNPTNRTIPLLTFN